MELKQNYEVDTSGPRPMPWERYLELIMPIWHNLLNEAAEDESALHLFFEQNPSFLPGPFGVGPNFNHGPLLNFVISEPVLPGLRRPRPDFLWLNKQSDRIFIVLIEIEAPAKRWFTAKGVPTAQLAEPMKQMADWDQWFRRPANVAQFQKLYWVRDNWWDRVPFEVHHCLVYGRRAEFEGNDHTASIRRNLFAPNVHPMTFDRLAPVSAGDSLPSAVVRGTDFEARFFPPTFGIEPYRVELGIARLKAKDEALARSPLMPDDRKDFLKKRFRYWDEWAKSPGRYFDGSGPE